MVMIGLRPSFFLFLLMAAAAAAAALVVVAFASLLPFVDAPAAPVIDGASAGCAWGMLCFRAAGRAAFANAPKPTPAPSLLFCCPPFMVKIRYVLGRGRRGFE